MANVKFIAVSRGLRGIVDYVTNREKTVEQLISGVNCVARTAVPEFEAVKKQFRKTEGRGYYHIVQAFAPDDPHAGEHPLPGQQAVRPDAEAREYGGVLLTGRRGLSASLPGNCL